MNTADILLKHVCPGVGAGIALIMFASPLPAVLRCNRSRCLGELNALPFAAMAINCASWVFYALLLVDYYIYFGNMPGVLLGTYYVLTCYKFSKEAAQDLLRNLFLAAFLLYWLMGFISMAARLSPAATKTLWGSTSVAVLGVYYVAPLTSVAKVVAERDSSSLHWPLCSMNIINGMLWFAYGLALKDWFISLPNGIGAGFNVVCLVLCFVFQARSRKAAEAAGQQSQSTGGRVLAEINPAANWGALRMQSISRPAGDSAAGAAAAAAVSQGGFFDITQLRWRTGRLDSLRGSFTGSFRRLMSGGGMGRNSSFSNTSVTNAGGAGAAASLNHSLPDIAEKGAGVSVVSSDQDDGQRGDNAGGIKAADSSAAAATAVGDVEQAHVIADASTPPPAAATRLEQQSAQQRQL